MEGANRSNFFVNSYLKKLVGYLEISNGWSYGMRELDLGPLG